MPYRLAILGHPIGHSLSPTFHTAAFKRCGLSGTYDQLDIAPGDLATSWRTTLSVEYDGFNVTTPHKVSVIPLLDDLTEEARIIGAVNVLCRHGKTWTGHNTDVFGITESLLPFQGRIEGSSAVVIGAGGAARAAIAALIGHLRCSNVMIINRDVKKAETLTLEWVSRGARVAATPIGSPVAIDALRGCRLIVQATSAGMHPDHEQSPLPDVTDFASDQIVFDLIYRPRETRFLRAARSTGATVIDGLEMFLHQAGASFELWTGSEVSPDVIRPVIEQELSDQ